MVLGVFQGVSGVFRGFKVHPWSLLNSPEIPLKGPESFETNLIPRLHDNVPLSTHQILYCIIGGF